MVQWSEPLVRFGVTFDVASGKFNQVRAVQAYLLAFGLRVVDFPAIYQHPPNHPECAHAIRCPAVDERGTILRIRGHL